MAASAAMPENGKVYPAMRRWRGGWDFRKAGARVHPGVGTRQKFIEVDRENKHYRKNGSGGTNAYFFLWHAAFDGDRGHAQAPHPGSLLLGYPGSTLPPSPRQ